MRHALVFLLLLGSARAWEEISGSCLGPASEHIPADAGSGWGQPGPYSIKIDGIRGGGSVCDSSQSGGCESVSVGTVHILKTGRRTVQKPEKHARRDDDDNGGGGGSGCWSGMLIKALDAATGLPLPAFASTPLPPNVDLFDGCTDKRSAITHTAETAWCAPFSLKISWPSSKNVAIQAFLVSDETEWYEVYGSTASTWVPAEMDCPRERLSIPAIIVGFAPIVIILLSAAILKHTPGLRGLSQALDQTGSAASPPPFHWVVSLLSFDVVSSAVEMSLGEWLAFAVFFVCQIVSLILMTLFISNVSRSGSGITFSPWDEPFARALGVSLMINMANTCFLPTRNSALGAMCGVSFERMVKYHRVVGRFTFVLVILHGAIHLRYWGILDCFSTRPICFGYNILWGSLSGILFIISMVGALDIVRRKLFEIFIFSHFLVVPAMVMACLHATDFVYFLIAPAALYLIDWILRILQTTRKSTVVSAECLADGIVKLEIECAAIAQALYDRKEKGLGAFVFVRCWQVSMNPLDLHPFTVSGLIMNEPSVLASSMAGFSGPPSQPYGSTDSQPGTPTAMPPPVPLVVAAQNGSVSAILADGNARGITLHIKSMGDGQWTDRLVKAAEGGRKLTVGLEGPHGELSVNIKAYSTVICFAGGIGITPFTHLLEMFISRKEECFPNVSKLVIVWSVQKMSQTKGFDALLNDAERWRGSAKIEIFVHATRWVVLSAQLPA
mmetsp:Transcript_29882/g.72025  ORF Transcript_29882/g.72025 Transcript_29882/m.72025 type:complete len:728 (+) Transcript_29882:42-2225(+)